MISQRCPKCGSSRIRRGYRPTPLLLKILFLYNLLCDGCNWEFRGFAVPGTTSWKPTKKQKSNEEVKINKEAAIINNFSENGKKVYKNRKIKKKENKKRMKIRF